MNVAPRPECDDIRVVSLCSGGGGLDLGLRLAVPSARVVCHVEIEAFAGFHLVAAMEAGLVDPAPVWSDVGTFDGRPWRGRVHILTAGYPCQPFSTAGRRLGEDDERHLWPDVRRIIDEIRPLAVFLENVEGHLSLGFDVVWGELHGLGYEVEAGLFSAAEVGSSHERCRLFILALANSADPRWGQPGSGPVEGWRSRAPWWLQPDGLGRDVADAQGIGGGPGSGEGGTVIDGASATGRGRALADPGDRFLPIEERGPEGRDGPRSAGAGDVADPGRSRLQGDEQRGSPRGGDGPEAPRSASEFCGAPLAHAPSGGRPQPEHRPRGGDGSSSGAGGQQADGAPRSDPALANTDAPRGPQPGGGLGEERGRAEHGGEAVVDPGRGRLERRGGPGSVSGASGQAEGEGDERERRRDAPRDPGEGVPLFPPGPEDLDAWRAVLAITPEIEPALRGMADGLAPRVDRLRMLGGGVVPLAAAHAFRALVAAHTAARSREAAKPALIAAE